MKQLPKNSMKYRIGIIGTGKLASHIAPALVKAGHTISVVCGRNREKAYHLAKKIGATNTTNLDFKGKDIDVLILAVSDDAIEPIIVQLHIDAHTVVAHTSGSTAIEVFSNANIQHYGVIYPLQTFSEGKEISFDEIPLFVEFNAFEAESKLTEVCTSLSHRTSKLDSPGRLMMHAAAVFACNFTNYMLRIAEELLNEKQNDLLLLKPLLTETLDKALNLGAAESQTGPAIRGDHKTMNIHHETINQYNAKYAELYKMVSEMIMGDAKKN